MSPHLPMAHIHQVITLFNAPVYPLKYCQPQLMDRKQAQRLFKQLLPQFLSGGARIPGPLFQTSCTCPCHSSTPSPCQLAGHHKRQAPSL